MRTLFVQKMNKFLNEQKLITIRLGLDTELISREFKVLLFQNPGIEFLDEFFLDFLLLDEGLEFGQAEHELGEGVLVIFGITVPDDENTLAFLLPLVDRDDYLLSEEPFHLRLDVGLETRSTVLPDII